MNHDHTRPLPARPDYVVGAAGATVFDDQGRLLAYLRPGSVIVPGVGKATTAERTADQEYPVRRRETEAACRGETA